MSQSKGSCGGESRRKQQETIEVEGLEGIPVERELQGEWRGYSQRRRKRRRRRRSRRKEGSGGGRNLTTPSQVVGKEQIKCFQSFQTKW